MRAEITLGAAPFDLGATLGCGQAFRWIANGDGSHTGVVRGAVATARQVGGEVRLAISGRRGVADAAAFEPDFWRSYFALDVDYAALHAAYRRNRTLGLCVDFAPGIRVLRQDFYETFLSFIISQNNNIARIRGIVGRLCDAFGEPAGLGPDGSALHAFPSADRLAGLAVADLAPLRAGYRAASILGGARQIAVGALAAGALATLPTVAARERLLEVRGVGPKIADCVLLFGLGRFESFPVDVWIRRAMAALFPRGLPRPARGTAGIAQQYIFHYMRCGRGGAST